MTRPRAAVRTLVRPVVDPRWALLAALAAAALAVLAR